MEKLPIARTENIAVQEMDGEVLVYDFTANKAYCLNKTSALIWRSCDGNKSLADITDDLTKNRSSSVDESLVWLALDQLKKENLIEYNLPRPAKLEGLSRREVIKKVGLASMIALPVISSVVAPTIAHAQSCEPPGSFISSCNSPGTCNCSPTQASCCSNNVEIGLNVPGFPGVLGCFCLDPITV